MSDYSRLAQPWPAPPAESTSSTSGHLEVYGLRVLIDGDWPETQLEIAQDFAWFVRDGAARDPDVRVTIQCRKPDYERFGDIAQAFITTRNVVYQSGAQTIIDYFGRALAVYDRAEEQLLLQGQDRHLIHEAAYLFLLSRIGAHLDRCGLMRVHALGLSGARGAVLVLLPSGGGKSTLALRALREPGVRLLSEDTPVLDRHGRVHPFPLRIGINVGDEHLLPDAKVRRIERVEYGPKLAVSIDAFRESIEHQPQPLRHVVLGVRSLGHTSVLTPLGRARAIAPLLRDGVVGVGVAQMVEYVLLKGARDFLKQGGVAAGRARICARALFGARSWQLQLGRDAERNWQALASLLH